MDHVPAILSRVKVGERVIYRGQPDASWNLKPSIGRHYTGKWEVVADRERQALKEFKRRSVPYVREKPTSDIEWLCLMQHHGCSTRLLDFTSNPLIALFFASEQLEAKDGRLIMATYTQSYPDALGEDLFAHKHAFAYHPPHITERIIGQSGCFVFCGEPNQHLNERNCESINIPAQYKPAIRAELKALGISNSTLFPGADGICQDINEALIYDLAFEEIPF